MQSDSHEIVWAHCYVVLFREDLLSLFVARTTDFNGKSKRFDPKIFFSGMCIAFEGVHCNIFHRMLWLSVVAWVISSAGHAFAAVPVYSDAHAVAR